MGAGGGMSLVLFGHPFSSYTWKVLIPLYADGTKFEFRQVPENEENYAELKRIWPAGKFPLLLDDGEAVIETTPIIEHLQAKHPGPNVWIPDGAAVAGSGCSIGSSTCTSRATCSLRSIMPCAPKAWEMLMGLN